MAPISTMPSEAITVYWVSLHQEKPCPCGLRAASSSVSKKFGADAASAASLRSARNFVERGLRLGALHAVDRIGVVAGDHQQPLDAGEAGLRVVIVGFLGEIDRRPFRRIGRPRRRKARLLADRTAARIADLEIAVADAEFGIAVLRQRRRAIDRRRARMQIDHVGIERAVHHLPALPGIDAEPAARRRQWRASPGRSPTSIW